MFNDIKINIFFNKLNNANRRLQENFIENIVKQKYLNEKILINIIKNKNLLKILLEHKNLYYIFNIKNHISEELALNFIKKFKIDITTNFFENYKTFDNNFTFKNLNNDERFDTFINKKFNVNKHLKLLYTYKFFESNFLEKYTNLFLKKTKSKPTKKYYHLNYELFIPYHLLLQHFIYDIDNEILENIFNYFYKMYENVLMLYQKNKLTFNIFYKLFLVFKKMEYSYLEEFNNKLKNIELKTNNKFLINRISNIRESFLYLNEDYYYDNPLVEYLTKNPNFLNAFQENYFDKDTLIDVLNDLAFKHNPKKNDLSYIINNFFIYITYHNILDKKNFFNQEEYEEFLNDIKEILVLDDLYTKEGIIQKKISYGIKYILNKYNFEFDLEYENNIINSIPKIYTDIDIYKLNPIYLKYYLYAIKNTDTLEKIINEKLPVRNLKEKEKKEYINIIIKNDLVEHYYKSELTYLLPIKLSLIKELRKKYYDPIYEKELYIYYLQNAIISDKEQFEIFKDIDEKISYNLIFNKNINPIIFEKFLKKEKYFKYANKILENLLF